MEGRDLLSLTPDELRRKIIMVPQTVSLFSGTLRENLCLAAPEASEQALWEALDDVWLKIGCWNNPWGWTPTWATQAKNFLAANGKDRDRQGPAVPGGIYRV